MVVRKKCAGFISEKLVVFGGICGGKLGFLGLSSEEERSGCMCMGAWGAAIRTPEHSMGPSPICRQPWALQLVPFGRQRHRPQNFLNLPR